MTYPLYHLYEEMILRRNQLFLMVGCVLLIWLGLIWLAGQWRPAWRPALWYLSIGVYYATLGVLAVLYFAGPEIS